MADVLTQPNPETVGQILGATPAMAVTTQPLPATVAAAPSTPQPDPQSFQAMMSATTANPNAVFSASNVQQTNNSPATPINTNDPLGITNSIYAQYGVNDAQAQYNNATAGIREFDNRVNSFTDQIGNQTVGMNVIRGQQRTMNEQAMRERAGLVSAAETFRDAYLAKKDQADREANLKIQQYQDTKKLMLQYPDAGIKFSDSDSKIAKKISKYNKEQDKKQEKSDLRKLYAAEFGYLPDKKTTSKQMRDELKKRGVDKYTLDTAVKRASLAKANSSSNKEYTNQEITQTIASILQQRQGDPDGGWGYAAEKLRSAGVSVTPGSYADNELRGYFGVPLNTKLGTTSTAQDKSTNPFE